ncbi:hypothetical protein [Streptomyces sp. NPDC005283]|uniref:hypothetical protein n=1 Tax=Streptomyces sp. NPDC005283 TaxID=3156871 RepID=UPI003454E965
MNEQTFHVMANAGRTCGTLNQNPLIAAARSMPSPKDGIDPDANPADTANPEYGSPASSGVQFRRMISSSSSGTCLALRSSLSSNREKLSEPITEPLGRTSMSCNSPGEAEEADTA